MSDQQDPKTPTPRAPIGRLNNLRSVRRELARVYADARLGLIRTADASRLAFVLGKIGDVLEVELLEERIAALEERAQRVLPNEPERRRLNA